MTLKAYAKKHKLRYTELMKLLTAQDEVATVQGHRIRVAKGVGAEDEESDGEEQPDYEIEAVLAHRVEGGVKQYFVSWKNYNSSHNTWEPATSFDGLAIAEQYEDQLIAKVPIVTPCCADLCGCSPKQIFPMSRPGSNAS